ncbi:hypothetical protein BC939DRAFT_321032 [Gamsiella multidivaricata]|uniref:uncharacterized protein n=1 Tax=Gamsiella multidivaricata TaxID=101098 RepID=UPI002220F938|nr:uncharacterized protein BC939DRAFT_321032 [Gamsiella multidivaricata]KAI7829766.1 hypothetical protein BC939DRAFT_321032 [Gamsiella multidivaricata]
MRRSSHHILFFLSRLQRLMKLRNLVIHFRMVTALFQDADPKRTLVEAKGTDRHYIQNISHDVPDDVSALYRDHQDMPPYTATVDQAIHLVSSGPWDGYQVRSSRTRVVRVIKYRNTRFFFSVLLWTCGANGVICDIITSESISVYTACPGDTSLG